MPRRSEKLELAKYTRHPDWPKVRRQFLKQHPHCEVCHTTKGLTAHHILPIWIYPALELEPTNLITLCNSGANHHLTFGHLCNYKSHNEHVVRDAEAWRKRIDERPKWKPFLTTWEHERKDHNTHLSVMQAAFYHRNCTEKGPLCGKSKWVAKPPVLQQMYS